MSVPVRPRSGPINFHFVTAGSFAAIAWWMKPAPGDWWQWSVIHWFFVFAAAVLTTGAIGGLIRDWRLRRALALSEIVTEDHGSAREATQAEMAARGMYSAEHGDLLGMDDDGRLVFTPAGSVFGLFLASPGFGKTICWVVGSILNRAMRGYSLVIPDPKCTLAYMLAPTLRQLGFEVWCINPARQYLDTVGEVELNLYQSVLDDLYGDGERRKDAIKTAADYAAIHYPPASDEKNPYFGHGSRRQHSVATLAKALLDPVNCTPTDVQMVLASRSNFLRLMSEAANLEGVIDNDAVVAAVREEARNQLSISETLVENHASFMEGMAQRMLSFSQAGRLGGYGRTATRNIADIRRRQIIVFIMAPLTHSKEFEGFISLLNHTVFAACKADPGGHPVHIVGEEALAYHWADLPSNMETMRELRVTADFYCQSFPGLVTRFGQQAAAAIMSYCDVRAFGGINGEEAKMVSDMLAETTIRKQDYSYQADAKELGVSSRELARRVATHDEVLSMPKDRAWVFLRGMHPKNLRMVNVGQVKPWCDWVGPNPISGKRLKADPLFEIHYPERRHA